VGRDGYVRRLSATGIAPGADIGRIIIPQCNNSPVAIRFVFLPRASAGGGKDGQITWAVHVSIAPTWFDPGEHPGIITSMMTFYALHDALVKPMPGNPLAPSLAEAWAVSPEGLVYEFALRRGVVFHNGDTMTAEDVKFSFERYHGAAAKFLKEKVAAVEVVDPLLIRFRLREPWPDFMAFYATPATGDELCERPRCRPRRFD
jgi:peptide/nickel transport system substrate-binding protein